MALQLPVGAVATTHQDIVNQIAALKPKYDALLEAETIFLQAVCGQIGHVIKCEKVSWRRELYRTCVVCGVELAEAKAGVA